MKKIITFIIPCYNVEQYLRKALLSMLLESCLDKTEILIINDGSTDHTAEIAEEFVQRYPDTVALINKENGGHGSAINIGSLRASGKFFKVVDADDWILSENLETYINKLELCDADAVLTPFHMVDMSTNNRIIQKMYISDYDRCYTLDDICANWKKFDRCTTFHGITYKTSFYNKHRHMLPEHIFYEDQEYATIPFCHAQNIAVFDLFLYQYLIGNSNQSVAVQNQIKRITHLETVILNLLTYNQQHKNTPNISLLYLRLKTEATILSFYTIMCIQNPNKKDGAKASRRLNRMVFHRNKALWKQTALKYIIYRIFNILHIDFSLYERLIHSGIFRRIRKNHKVEKED